MLNNYFEQYGIIGLFLITAILVPLGMLLLSKLSQYIRVRPHNPSEIKESMYECGMKVDAVRWQGYNLRYYYYALIFIVFDIETVFLFPWAVKYGVLSKQFGVSVLLAMILFLFIVTLGYVYAWKKGDLEWK